MSIAVASHNHILHLHRNHGTRPDAQQHMAAFAYTWAVVPGVFVAGS
jgi:hypothetical protein